jgi:hypothetical protein
MKIIRAIGLTFALLTPAIAFATPKMDPTCCDSWCCPSCPHCPSGLHK